MGGGGNSARYGKGIGGEGRASPPPAPDAAPPAQQSLAFLFLLMKWGGGWGRGGAVKEGGLWGKGRQPEKQLHIHQVNDTPKQQCRPILNNSHSYQERLKPPDTTLLQCPRQS